jgi:hypothetical protein
LYFLRAFIYLAGEQCDGFGAVSVNGEFRMKRPTFWDRYFNSTTWQGKMITISGIIISGHILIISLVEQHYSIIFGFAAGVAGHFIGLKFKKVQGSEKHWNPGWFALSLYLSFVVVLYLKLSSVMREF